VTSKVDVADKRPSTTQSSCELGPRVCFLELIVFFALPDVLPEPMVEKVDGPFLFHHWLWQHVWQRKEHKQFLELIECVKKTNSRSEFARRLGRAWTFVCDINLGSHQKMEDECFFPEVQKAVGPEGQRQVAVLEKQHEALHKELESVTAAVQVVVNDPSNDALDALLAQAEKFFTDYALHIEQEENVLVPLAKREMSVETQRQVGANIKAFLKGMDSAKFLLLQLRDTVQDIPSEKERFDNFFPAFLRFVLLPIWSWTDGLYSEYYNLFVQPW